jgi:HK97 family phage prohead protease
MGTEGKTEVKIVYKAAELKAVADGEYEFVASDESVDRYGDIVAIDGWELANYKRNPVVLYQHQNSSPVGISKKVWIEDKQLKARIKLADEGTSPFIDSLRKLMDQKILRAVSVGFMPTVDPVYIRDPKNEYITGYKFVGQELLEISIVTVPANANALAIAKGLNIPELHLQRVFAPAKKDASVRMAQNKSILEAISVRRRVH